MMYLAAIFFAMACIGSPTMLETTSVKKLLPPHTMTRCSRNFPWLAHYQRS